MGSVGVEIQEVDCLVVGAGFGGCALLRKLLQQGFNVKAYERAASFGGIWYWNCYPGARVDTDGPTYQFFDKEIWEDFTFKDRYPDWQELRRYFAHVDKKWNLSKHIKFNKTVEAAIFNEERRRWLVECADGSQTWCRFFLPCLGFAAKKYLPPIPGLSSFHGELHHTAVWPQHGVDLKNKRVAVIGTGASGIQLIQEIGDDCKHLIIYQRTPNFCLPMNQKQLNLKEEQKKKDSGYYEETMANTRHMYAAFDYEFLTTNALDVNAEEREQTFHRLMIEEGGFKFWLATYKDILFVKEANNEAYRFWRDTVRKRITDPKKRELLAPEIAPHPWGTKRPSLEQRFYEVVDQPHIDIIDVNRSPIEEVTPQGIRTKDEGVVEVDIIILATGFDSVTGSLAQLQIHNAEDGSTLVDHWKQGVRTATGIASRGFPNMFFLYGPQAPTGFANGPPCTQYQAQWLTDFLVQARNNGFERIEATKDAEDVWNKRTQEAWNASLFPQAKSWYQGSNIPGKVTESLNWAGGLPAYMDALEKSLENDYQGWKIQTARS